jgi:hypothetical protein
VDVRLLARRRATIASRMRRALALGEELAEPLDDLLRDLD